jgi:rRNA-processing protein FCF1
MPQAPRPTRPGGSAGSSSPTRTARSPLEGASRLIVDGTNLLYRMGSGGAAPPAAVIGRLRAAIPGTVAIDLVFDGMGHGVFGRVAQGMYVRYSGRRTADDVILDLVSEAAWTSGAGAAAAARVLVVSNDRELRALLTAKGARTASLQWLLTRLDLPVLAAPAAGNRRPPIGAGSTAHGRDATDDDDRPRWKPGRGATSKVGPARKVARHKRHPRQGA